MKSEGQTILLQNPGLLQRPNSLILSLPRSLLLIREQGPPLSNEKSSVYTPLLN